MRKAFLIFVSLAIFGVVWFITQTRVKLTVDGKTSWVRTHAKTVEALLKEKDITCSMHDEVKPSKATSIHHDLHVNIQHAVSVTVFIGKHSRRILTTKKTVKEALSQANISVSKWDKVKPFLATPILPEMAVYVTKAVLVELNIGGKIFRQMTFQSDVGGVLKELNIKLGLEDKLFPDSKTAITPSPSSSMKVTLLRVRKEKKTIEEILLFSSLLKFDTTLYRGERRIVQTGKNGRVKKDVEVVFINGHLTTRKVLAKKVIALPKPEIVVVGVKPRYLLGARSGVFQNARVVDMEASAYDPGPASCGPYANGYTSIGLKAGYGVVAVDPSVIPLRSRLFIEGYGYAIAGDIGSAIKGYRIDLGFDTYREAIHFGRKRVKVYILE